MRGERALDELFQAVADHAAHRRQGMGCEALRREQLVDGCRDVRRGVDERPVEVEQDHLRPKRERGRTPADHAARVPEGAVGGGPDRGDVARVGLLDAALEDRRAGDQHVGAGRGDQRRGLRRHAAVDLDVDRPAADQRLDAASPSRPPPG